MTQLVTSARDVGSASKMEASSPSPAGGQHMGRKKIKATRTLIIFGLFLGTLNNLPFCVLMGAGQKLANDFDMGSCVSLLTTASAVASITSGFQINWAHEHFFAKFVLVLFFRDQHSPTEFLFKNMINNRLQ